MSAMSLTTLMARITGPVAYIAASGKRSIIPLGPCLIEQGGAESVDIIWGARGQSCATLPIAQVQAAQSQGQLVLLD